ncbi:t-snare proteins like protein [Babesia gibsoni]|uniref:T-snare proteins like protein n=1 Tax=Babesia gibsoni TaxID=33632 RepID=A0AAD8UUJ7_BABGI|nr:t-snare proteins like protein [Babesia gibsoni]
MYNRTYQLQSLAEGLKASNKYKKDCIIVFDDSDVRLPLKQNSRTESTYGDFGRDFTLYMTDVGTLRSLIAKIDEGANDINSLLYESASAVTNEQNSAISTKLNELIAKTNSICTQCKASASAIEKRKNNGSPTEARMRENAYNVSLKHFQAAIVRYQESQVNFKKAIKERTVRQIQLIYPDVRQDELNRMLLPGRSHSVLEFAARSSILGNSSLTDAVNSIQSKYNDVLALEESVEELHQMMIELAAVVAYQGDLIDQVENNAMKAVEYTEKAAHELVLAHRNKKRRNKMIMYITMGLTVGGIVVIVPLVMKLS